MSKKYRFIRFSISDVLDKLPVTPENTLSCIMPKKTISKAEEVYISSDN